MKKLSQKHKFILETLMFIFVVVVFFLNFVPYVDFKSKLYIYSDPPSQTEETSQTADLNDISVPATDTDIYSAPQSAPAVTTTIFDERAVVENDLPNEPTPPESDTPENTTEQQISTTTAASSTAPQSTTAAPQTTASAAPVTNSTTAQPAEIETRVNINTADLNELMTLNGIGKVKGQAIIDYRNEHGPFSSVDELIEVKGIGEKTLEKLREFVMV